MNRWSVVLGAVLIQLCLGAIYAWSIFVEPLKKTFGYSQTETQIIFSVALASFALMMILAGRWQDCHGPKKIATLGGIVLGVGYLLAGQTGGSFIEIAATVGLVGGAGIGLAYVCPIAACVKWFPDKRGMVSGLAVAGFGAGALVFAKYGAMWITSAGVLSTFTYFGVIFLLAVVFGAQLLRNPPEGYKPEGWNPPATAAKANGINLGGKEIIHTRQFWTLWLMFMFAATAGLMVIGNLKPFGVYSGLDAATATTAVGVLALANGAGRILWGTGSDKLGRKNSLAIMMLLQGVMMLALMKMGATPLLLTIAVIWVGFNFGGNFALFPSATADYFGTKNVGINYGLIFTSYGVAGIVGPILAGSVFDKTGSYLWAFIPAGTACLIAAGLALTLKAPTKK
ncbi:Major Facilitator Superfamily protein [uncultured archaeon]|nr:Major Facilitator Superfamily protein [uncultured archaeon]